MNRKLMVVFAAALLLVPVAPLALGSVALTVATGGKYFNAGNTVTISGTAPANATVHINIARSNSSVFAVDVAVNATTHAYSAAYVLPANATVGIYTVTATSGTEDAKTVFIVTTVSTAEMAQQMISAAQKSQILAQETIQAIVDGGYAVPSAVNATMALGASRLAEAQTLYASGNYVAASEAAQRAMELFKNAMTIAIRAGRVEENVEEDLNQTLRYQIERLQKETQRIQEVVTNLADAGSNVTAIQAKITAADASLTSATAQLEAGNYTQARQAVNEAKVYIRDAMQLLKDLYTQVRRALMLEYKNHMWVRLNATKGDIGKLKDYIGSSNLTAAFKNFGQVESYIKRCEERMNSSDDEGALDDLEAASQKYDSGISALDSNGYSKGMMSTNAIRAQIQALEQQKEQLKKRGGDTSAVESKIEALQSLLDQGMGMMQKGNANGANDVFEHGHMGRKGR